MFITQKMRDIFEFLGRRSTLLVSSLPALTKI